MSKDALLIVDVQNDFCPGGTLPVADGDKVVRPINKMIPLFGVVFASRDWHPPITNHFKAYGGKWPAHCVQNTWGAKFHHNLQLPTNAHIISKGIQKDEDAYSAFQGKGLCLNYMEVPPDQSLDNGIPFFGLLMYHGIEKLFVCGLATDYCVKHTVLDALLLGFKVYVIEDAIRGVDVNSGDSERAKEAMLNAGAKFTNTDVILGYFAPPYE